MRLVVIIIGVLIMPLLGNCQYTYFNNTYQFAKGRDESSTAVEIENGKFLTVSGVDVDTATIILFREYDSEGAVTLTKGYPVYEWLTYIQGHAALEVDSANQRIVYCEAGYNGINTISRVFCLNYALDTLWTSGLDLYPEFSTNLNVLTTLADGYLFFGFRTLSNETRDLLCVKLNLQGEYQWHWVLEEPGSQTPFNVYKISETEFLVGGGLYSSDDTTDGWLKRVTIDGDVLWSETFGSNGYSDGGTMAVSKLQNGNYYTTYGISVSGQPDWSQLEMQGVEFSIDPIFQEVETTPYYTYLMQGQAKSVICNDGTMAVLSGHYDDQADIHSYILKTLADGTEEWLNFYSYNDCSICSNFLQDIELAPDGGYICAGYFIDYSDEIPLNKTWLLKIDACGEVEYNGCPPSANGVAENGSHAPLVSASPNPAKDILHLNADMGVEIKSIAIFDAVGQCVLQQQVPHFTGSLSLDIAHLSTGIYFVKAQDDERKEWVMKVVVE